MPACLIQHHDHMFVICDGLGEAVQKGLHRHRIGIGQHQREGVVRARIHSGEDIGECEAFIAKPWRALAALPPDMADAPLLADARLILEEQADALAFMTCADGLQQRRGSF